MQGFKRNQVEEALAKYFGRSEPDTELRTRIKRLLDTDRKLPLLDEHPQRKRAFYSDEGPGRGNEVFFSEYEAFALQLGLRLLNHYWPQQTAVELLRNARHDLTRAHREILGKDPKMIFDPLKISKQHKNKPYAGDNTCPTFFVIVSDSDSPQRTKLSELEARVCPEEGAFAYMRKKAAATFLELVTPAHKLRQFLRQSSPTKRGRS